MDVRERDALAEAGGEAPDPAAVREANREKYSRLLGEDEDRYDGWIRRIEAEERHDQVFSYNPKISVLVPVYNVLDRHLIPCIESVLDQSYTNWELCIADDCSTWENVRGTLERYEAHEKVKIVYREENGHISQCTNSALAMATGEYIAFLDCDDVLSPHALYEMVRKLNEDPELDFIYSDEDKIPEDGGKRHTPHFKPDWSPDTLMSMMYTCHFSLYRRSIANELGGLRTGYEGAQDYDFALRFTERTSRIAHIPRVLYHWRERQESTSGNIDAKPYVRERARKAKEDALRRRGLKGKIEFVNKVQQLRVNYVCDGDPLVSIVIPSRDNFGILERCVATLKEKTAYGNYELLVVDNGSRWRNKLRYQKLAKEYGIRYIYRKLPFNFARMCNIGAEQAAGEYLLFLNDDMEIVQEDWLDRMAGQASVPHAGAVGAKLLYPGSSRIQHTGIINLAEGPCHALAGYDDNGDYYFARNLLDYDYAAVTGACLMISAEKFRQAGGFDEELQVAYNDVELCFRLVEQGYFNVVRNDVILYHHESYSRGYDSRDEAKAERQRREKELLYKKHPAFAGRDPFYNINLTQRGIDFALNEEKAAAYREVAATAEKYQRAEGVTGCLDTVYAGEYIRIEGWIVNMLSQDNNGALRRILLEGRAASFTVGADVVYRKDVGDAYPEHPDFDFSGVRCMIRREDLPRGVYRIHMLWNDAKLDTGRELEIM